MNQRRSLRLSEEGRKKVEMARIQKGWSRWEISTTAMISESTLKRFFQGKPISADNFVRICKSVGIDDWQRLIDYENFTENIDSCRVGWNRTSEAGSSEINNSPQKLEPQTRYSITITGIFNENQKLQVEGVVAVLKKLLSDSYIIVQGGDLDIQEESELNSTDTHIT